MEDYNALNAFTPTTRKCVGALAGTSGRQILLGGRFTF
jgi:hypothetical protein